MHGKAYCRRHSTTFTSCIDVSIFPDKLKTAQVRPLFKKNNILEKGNYRPVSVLPTISKFVERAIFDQLTDFFNFHFHPSLSAFRKGFGCQTALLKIIEDWKKALDENKYIAAILMDLSKAFDCLPHDLILLKLEAYGLSEKSINLLNSYLSGRKQCVKVKNICSSFETVYKGVPQGSILGPILFKIFINDIFYSVDFSTIYNYADDNTLSYADHDLKNVISKLESDSQKMLDWFANNLMQANPDKFQALAIGKKTFKEQICFDLNGSKIKCEEHVKLLGVTIDYELNFDKHISEICKKSAGQLNVLKRIGRYLNKLGRLTIYYSFILSNFNYCPVTWHFCSEKNTKKMEKIQERALRFIYNDYVLNYEELLEKSKMPSLKVRRLRSIAIETFKIIHKESPIYLHDLVNIKKHNYSFRYENTADVPSVKTTRYGLKSFRYFSTKLWNELPNHIRLEQNLNQFSKLLNTWNGGSCHCSACV